MLPKYDLDKIKFATDEVTFEKAIWLYENSKITEFKEIFNEFSAVVIGTNPYNVVVSPFEYDRGNCTCYLGQNNTLCKHMVAVAIRAVTGGRKLSEEDKKLKNTPICSNKLGKLTQDELDKVKKSLQIALRYIKPYRGPSKFWFAYQDSLTEGCNRLSAIITDLPISDQMAELLVDLLLRLDKKLSQGGVDDSDGTVGEFIEESVNVLKEYVKLDPSCKKTLKALQNKETVFGWEEPLLQLLGE